MRITGLAVESRSLAGALGGIQLLSACTTWLTRSTPRRTGSFGSDVSTQVDQIHEAIGHALSRDVVLQCLQGAGGFGERALLSWLRRVLLLWIGLVAFAKVPCTTASFLLYQE